MSRYFRWIGFLGVLLLTSTLAAQAADGDFAESASDLAERVETLKLEAVTLARDIALLERELGAEQGRVTVFVSLDPRLGDQLEQIELKIGDQIVAEHRYSASENAALAKDGAHRLYTAALAPDRHVLEANLSAHGKTGRVRKSTKLSFRNEQAPKTIELRLEATDAGLAELTVREWD
jgi:hypothetical protein